MCYATQMYNGDKTTHAGVAINKYSILAFNAIVYDTFNYHET